MHYLSIHVPSAIAQHLSPLAFLTVLQASIVKSVYKVQEFYTATHLVPVNTHVLKYKPHTSSEGESILLSQDIGSQLPIELSFFQHLFPPIVLTYLQPS